MPKTEIKNVKLHCCRKQRNFTRQKFSGVNRLQCRCRKFISYEQAKILVDQGLASPVVLERIEIEIVAPCKLCTEETRKSCQECHGIGQTVKIEFDERYSVCEIVSATPHGDIAKKTPRVATIEKAHIERAYAGEGAEQIAEQKRIEAYGISDLEARTYLGKDRTFVIKPEPPDDPILGTGRKYDYGYSIFCGLAEYRTPGGIGITVVDHPNESVIQDDTGETE